MIKHIIFDFDGTLADSSGIGIHIFNELAEKYRYKKLSIDELRLINNQPIKERLKRIGVPVYKIPQLSYDALNLYRTMVDSLKTFEGIQKMVTGLKNEGYYLSILSSNSVDNIEYFIKKYELNYFDSIISAKNIFGKDKAIKSYLKKFKLNSNEIIYVGDELRDIEACKRISVKIISVIWGYDSFELLQSANPDYISHKPEDINEIIKTLKEVSAR